MPLGLRSTNMGAVSTPGLPLPQNRFRRPEDALANKTFTPWIGPAPERVWQVRPKGVWPSEGSVSEEVFSIAQKLGVNWMATDEGVLGRSTSALNFARDGNG